MKLATAAVALTVISFSVPAMGQVEVITDANFEEEVIEASHKKPVTVTLEADWCPACRKQMPILNQVSKMIGKKAVIGRLNVDNNRIARSFPQSGIPTTFVFYKGQAILQFTGLQTAGQIIDAISKAQKIELIIARKEWKNASPGDMIEWDCNDHTHRYALLMQRGEGWLISRKDQFGKKEGLKSFESILKLNNPRLVKGEALKEVQRWQSANPYPANTIQIPNKRLEELHKKHPRAFAKVHFYMYHTSEFGWTKSYQVATAILEVVEKYPDREVRTALLTEAFWRNHREGIASDLKPSKLILNVDDEQFNRLLTNVQTNGSKALKLIENEALISWPETLCHIDDILRGVKGHQERIALLGRLLQTQVDSQGSGGEMYLIIPVPIYPNASPDPPPPTKKGGGISESI